MHERSVYASKSRISSIYNECLSATSLSLNSYDSVLTGA